MQETILPPIYDTTTPLPVVRTGWQRWIRRPLTWIVVGFALLGMAAALIFTVGRSGPVTPASILKSDGYTASVTFNHQQLVQAMNSGGSTPGLNPGDYFTTAAAGYDGSNGEVVLGMTDQGKGLDPLVVNMLNSQGGGIHAKTVDNGMFIVMTGPGSAFSNSNGTAL
jgi:hypothetical protein